MSALLECASQRQHSSLAVLVILCLLFAPCACESSCPSVESLLAKNRRLEERIAELELELVEAKAIVLKHESKREEECQQRESLKRLDVEDEVRGQVSSLNAKLQECKLLNAKLTEELGVIKVDPLLSEETKFRRVRYLKVVGAQAPDDNAAQFLLHLSLVKLQAGDFDGALASLREHLRLFWGQEEAVGFLVNRSVEVVGAADVSQLMMRLMKEEAAKDLIHQTAQALAAVTHDDSRRAGAALFQLYLTVSPRSASAWHGLAVLEHALGQTAEALECCRVARLVAPHNTSIKSACRAMEDEALATRTEFRGETKVFLLDCEDANAYEQDAMQLFFAALSAQPSGLRVHRQVRRGKSRKRNASEGSGRFISLSVSNLSAGDVVVFLSSSPPSPHWMLRARRRHVSLVAWSVSHSALNPRVLFSSSAFHWSAAAISLIFEPTLAPLMHEAAASLATPAASSCSLPACAGGCDCWRLEPPPRSVYRNESKRPPATGCLRALCVGSERKCSRVLHRVLGLLLPHGLVPTVLARVVEVLEGSPAGEAGLRPEDLVLAFGRVSGGAGDEQKLLAEEVESKRGSAIPVTLLRPSCDFCLLSLRVTPRAWEGSGLLGCRLSFADVISPSSSSPSSSSPSSSSPSSFSSSPSSPPTASSQHAEVLYLPTLMRGDTELEMPKAQVVVVQEEEGSVIEAEELRNLAYVLSQRNVTVMIQESMAPLLPLRYPEVLLVPPAVSNVSSMIVTRLLQHGPDEKHRREVEEQLEGMGASFERSAVRLVSSARLLFLTVALTPEEEEASLTFIISAKMCYPLATVEVAVLDSLRFWHSHGAAVEGLQAKGLWNEVWISQISHDKLEEGGEGDGEAFRHWLALTWRPRALLTGRSFQSACLLPAHHIFLPPSDLAVALLLNNTWRRRTYVSRVRGGERLLPLCCHPHKFFQQVLEASVNAPAASEPPGLFLFHSLMKLGGVPFSRDMADVEAALSGLGLVVSSSFDSFDLSLCPLLPAMQKLRSHSLWISSEYQSFPAARKRRLELLWMRCANETYAPALFDHSDLLQDDLDVLQHEARQQQQRQRQQQQQQGKESGHLGYKASPNEVELERSRRQAQEALLWAQVQSMFRSAKLKEGRRKMKEREELQQVKLEEKTLQELAASHAHPMFERATQVAAASASLLSSPLAATSAHIPSEKPSFCSLLLGLGSATGRWKILSLPEGGSARKSGKVKVGEQLMKVGGKDVESATASEIQQKLVGPAREEVELEVMSEEGERRIVSLHRDC